MRLNDDAKFPWPVLSPHTHDYPKHDFEVDLVVAETPKSGRLSITYKVALDEENMLRGLAEDDLAIGLYTTCLKTYFCELRTISAQGGVLDFPPGSLGGPVEFLPIIWALRDIDRWEHKNVHEEFGPGPSRLRQGDPMAIGSTARIIAGREKLAPIETIFELVNDSRLIDGEIKLNLENDKIQIFASPSTYQMLNTYRNVDNGRKILLNSIYLPAVMEVLLNLGNEKSAFEQKRWYQPFVTKCEHLGVKIGGDDVWGAAQKLLKHPARQLDRIKGGVLS